MFADPKACLALVEDLRWPSGFICPECGQRCEPWRGSRNRLVCPSCRYQGSATAGTALDRARLPLLIWFKVAWYLANDPNKIPVTELSHRLGVRYRSTWEMLHLFRAVMGNCYRRRLEGTVLILVKPVRTVEVQETPVLIAIEVVDRKRGEARLYRLDGSTEANLISGFQRVAAPGTTVILSGVPIRGSFKSHGYLCLPESDRQECGASDRSMGVAYKHAEILRQRFPKMVRGEYIQFHLDEVVYRFNRASVLEPGLRFRDLVQELVTTDCRESSIVGF